LGYLDIALCCSLEWMLFRQRYPARQHYNLARFLDSNAGRKTLRETHPSLAQNTAMPKVAQ
jgi:hypothetical protein